MSHFRRAAKVDANQAAIVRALRSIPGVTVAPGHDDLLVGFRGETYWLEIKRPGKERQLTASEIARRDGWTGHWRVAATFDEAMDAIGIGKKEDGR